MSFRFVYEQRFLGSAARRRRWRRNDSTVPTRTSDGSARNCCPLPFFLQDLCLWVVINELDCYPTELLAALPYWLRCRILNNVPALDLYRLASTPIARGVDTDGIWKSLLKANHFKNIKAQYRYQLHCWPNDVNETESQSKGSPFQLNVCRKYDDIFSLTMIPNNIFSGSTLTKDIIRDLNHVKDTKFSIGNHLLLEIVTDLLTTPYGTDLRMATGQLVSIPGNLVLSNLLIGSMHEDCQNPFCNHEVWRKQAVALVVKEFTHVHSDPYFTISNHRAGDTIIHLIPRRFLPLCDNPDPVELLSLLSDCQLNPCGVNIHINTI